MTTTIKARRVARRAAVLTATALMMMAPAAHASLTVGVQSEGQLVAGSDAAAAKTLGLAGQVHAGWVRMMVIDGRYEQQRWAIIRSAKLAHARGMKVMVSMFHWNGPNGEEGGAGIGQLTTFVNRVVPDLAPYVDAYGWNEPNHPAFAPRSDTVCTVVPGSKTQQTLVGYGHRVLVRYRHVKRGRGHYTRTVTFVRSRRLPEYKRTSRGWRKTTVGATHKRLVKFHRHRRLIGNYRQIKRRIPIAPHEITVSTPYERNVCQRQASAIEYRRVHDMTARVVRRVDPSALMILGELGPSAGNESFMENVFKAAAGSVDADVIGLHPYTLLAPSTVQDHGGMVLPVIERTVRAVRRWHAQGKITGERVWATEYGYHWAVVKAHPSWLPTALTRMRAAGVEVAVLYDYVHTGGSWDTGVFAGWTARSTFPGLRTWAQINEEVR